MSAFRSTAWAKRFKTKPIGMRVPRTTGLSAIAAGSTATRSVRVSVSAYVCPPGMPKVKGDRPPAAPSLCGQRGQRDLGSPSAGPGTPNPQQAPSLTGGAPPAPPAAGGAGLRPAQGFPHRPPLAPRSYSAFALSPPGCGCAISSLRSGNARPAPPPWRGRSASSPSGPQGAVRKMATCAIHLGSEVK